MGYDGTSSFDLTRDYEYAYDDGKNTWLIKNRNISFDRIITLIKSGKVVETIEHPHPEKYSGQLIHKVVIDGYIYYVPFVMEGNKVFLKTAYPSRKATRKYKNKGGST